MSPYTRWKYVILGTLMMLALGTVYSWSVFRLDLEKHFLIGSFESGLPYMVSLASYAFFMMITGKYIRPTSFKKLLIIGSIFVAFGYGLSAFSPSIYWMIVTYGILAGAEVGIIYGIPISLVSEWFPKHKGLAVGLVLVGFGMSPLITAPLVKELIAKVGVMQSFLFLGGFFLLALPLLSLQFKYPILADKENLHENARVGQLFKDKEFQNLYLLFLIGSFIGLSVIGLTSGAGIKWFELPANQVASFIAFFAVCNGIGRPLFGYLCEKLGPRLTMRLSYVSIAIACLLGLVITSKGPLLFVLVFSILWLNLGAWLAIAPTTTRMYFGRNNYSRNYGYMFTAYGLGAILGVAITGFLVDRFSYVAVLYCIGTLSVLAFMLTLKGNPKPHAD